MNLFVMLQFKQLSIYKLYNTSIDKPGILLLTEC